MKLCLVAVTIVALLAGMTAAGAAPAPQPAADANVLFAGGGTPLSNGLFFPGTQLVLNGEYYGEPLQIQRGTNVTFVNVDASIVANAHQVISFKRNKKTGAALFQSPQVPGPGQATIRTERLKPGTYRFYCPIHAGMLGAIQVTE